MGTPGPYAIMENDAASFDAAIRQSEEQMNRIPTSSANRGTVRPQVSRTTGSSGGMHLVNLPEGGIDDEFANNPAETLNRPNVVDDLNNEVATILNQVRQTEQILPDRWRQDLWDLAFRGQFQIKRQAVAQTVARGTVLLYADSNLDGFVDDAVASPLGLIVYLTKTHKLRVDDYIIKTSLVSATGNFGRLSNFTFPKGTWSADMSIEDCKAYGRDFNTITNDGDQTNIINMKPITNAGFATTSTQADFNGSAIVPTEVICMVDEPPRSTYSENPGDYTFLAFLEFGPDFQMSLPNKTLYAATRDYFAQFTTKTQQPNVPVYQNPSPIGFTFTNQDLVVGSKAYPNPTYTSKFIPGSGFPELEGGIGLSFSQDDIWCFVPTRYITDVAVGNPTTIGWTPLYKKGDTVMSFRDLWAEIFENTPSIQRYEWEERLITGLKRFYDSVKLMRFEGKTYWQTPEMRNVDEPITKNFPKGFDYLSGANEHTLQLFTRPELATLNSMDPTQIGYQWVLCTSGSIKTWYGWAVGIDIDTQEPRKPSYYRNDKVGEPTLGDAYLDAMPTLFQQELENYTVEGERKFFLAVGSYPNPFYCYPVDFASTVALRFNSVDDAGLGFWPGHMSWTPGVIEGSEHSPTLDPQWRRPLPPKEVNFISGLVVKNNGSIMTIVAEAGQQAINHSYNSLTLSNSSTTTTTTVGTGAIPSQSHFELIQFCISQLGSVGSALTFELVDSRSNRVATCFFSYNDGLCINATQGFRTLVLPQLHIANVQTNPVSVPITDTSVWDSIVVETNSDKELKGAFDFVKAISKAEEQMMAIGGALSGLGSGLGNMAGMWNANEQNQKDRELQERLTMEGYQNYLKRIQEQGTQDRRLQELRFENALTSGGAIKNNHLQRTPYTEADSESLIPNVEGGLYRSINGNFDSVANNSQLHGNMYDIEMENAKKKKLPVTDRPGQGSTKAYRVSGPNMSSPRAQTTVQKAAGRVAQRSELSTSGSQFGTRMTPIKVGPRVGRSANKNSLQRESQQQTKTATPQGWKGIKLNGPLKGSTLGSVSIC